MDFTNSSQTFMVDILHEEVDAHTMGEVSIMVEAVEGETAGEKGVTTEDLLPQEEVAMVSDCNIQTNMSALGDFSVVFCSSFTLIGSIFFSSDYNRVTQPPPEDWSKLLPKNDRIER